MSRRSENLLRRSLLHDAAVTHDEDAVGDLADDGEVMRDEEHGETMLAAEAFEQRDDLRLHGDIECGGGFVCNEQARTIDERHRDHDALALATGELMRVVVEAAFGVGQRDLMKHGENTSVEFCARDAWRVRQDSFGDLAADAHDRIERGHRLLKDHRDGPATMCTHVLFVESEEIFGSVWLAGELKATGDGRGWREKPEQSEGGR
jgi:hypothetical protein